LWQQQQPQTKEVNYRKKMEQDEGKNRFNRQMQARPNETKT